MTRIVQLSDTHIVAAGARAYGVVDTAAALARAVGTIAALETATGPIDRVIVTGDLTDQGTAEEYARFRALCAGLRAPLSVVPGNHDTREGLRAAFADLAEMPEAGPVNWRLEAGEAVLVGLDTSVPGQPHGALAAGTLDWLAGVLDEAGTRPVFVGLHHPPFETGIGFMDAQRLAGPEALLALLARHAGPVLVGAGHVHRFIATRHGDASLVIAPSPAHAVTLDTRPGAAGSFTLEPGGVLLHEWTGAAVGFRSQFVPVGRFDGPYPFRDPEDA